MNISKLRAGMFGNRKTGSVMVKETQGRLPVLQNRLRMLAVNARERGTEALEAGRNQIRRRPLATMAGALLAGMALDRWVLRR